MFKTIIKNSSLLLFVILILVYVGYLRNKNKVLELKLAEKTSMYSNCMSSKNLSHQLKADFFKFSDSLKYDYSSKTPEPKNNSSKSILTPLLNEQKKAFDILHCDTIKCLNSGV